jgi:hypothetical protein
VVEICVCCKKKVGKKLEKVYFEDAIIYYSKFLYFRKENHGITFWVEIHDQKYFLWMEEAHSSFAYEEKMSKGKNNMDK